MGVVGTLGMSRTVTDLHRQDVCRALQSSTRLLHFSSHAIFVVPLVCGSSHTHTKGRLSRVVSFSSLVRFTASSSYFVVVVVSRLVLGPLVRTLRRLVLVVVVVLVAFPVVD